MLIDKKGVEGGEQPGLGVGPMIFGSVETMRLEVGIKDEVFREVCIPYQEEGKMVEGVQVAQGRGLGFLLPHPPLHCDPPLTKKWLADWRIDRLYIELPS
jgi:hypothetical protein